MNDLIEYNGHTIESTTKRVDDQEWTLEVRITPTGDETDVRRCRAPNTYPTKKAAVANSLAFGRQIVDGKLQPKK